MKKLLHAFRQSRTARAGYRTAHFLKTGHRPKRMRFPNGIPRVAITEECLKDAGRSPFLAQMDEEYRAWLAEYDRKEWELIFHGPDGDPNIIRSEN